MIGSLTPAAVVFWISAGLVTYTYLLYPVVLWLLTEWRRVPAPPADATSDAGLPAVSVLVVAHNEEAFMQARLENLLALDYPRERLELVVASDGSTDRTNDIVRRYGPLGVALREITARGGKTAALNEVIPDLRGDIVVLSDANTMMEPVAVRRLARWFADRSVGVVCGRLVLTDPATGTNVDGLYWKYETFLKKREHRLGGLLGANGAIYAIRRTLFVPLRPGTIVDDFVIPLAARLRSRCRILYDETAVAFEDTPAEMGAEFRRRTRIGAGDFQSLGQIWPALLPWQGWISFTFVSHKLLRWMGPFLLLGTAGSNLLLLERPFYRATLVAQLGLYLVAALGVFVPTRSVTGKVVRLATMFASMNAALLVGFFTWMTTPQQGTWERTAR